MTMSDDWGAFAANLGPEERNRQLTDFADAVGQANSLALRRVAFWIKVAKIDWCEESKAGLRRTIRELPSKTYRNIIKRYQEKVIASVAASKAKQGVAA